MRDKQTILEQYQGYLKAIKKCDKKEIPYNFKKFRDFLDQNTDDDEFFKVVLINTINNTIRQVEAREVKLKEIAKSWSSRAVKNCWELVNKVNEKWKKEIETYDMNVSDELKVKTAQLFRLIEEQTDPSLQLYMYKCFMDTDNGYELFTSEKTNLKQLLEPTHKEELETVLVE